MTHVKSQKVPLPLTWVATDTSEIFLADVNLERNRWTACVADRAGEPSAITADVLAFLDTGAYQDASANNFNALPRPATVLVNGGDAEVIKRAETADEVFARDVIPVRFLR